ncbi:type I restriction enzyme, S subunit [Alkalibacterium thalassium]|uniref:Type I restriction enzyme, S subunit n=2 Tax=Alkalibacterium thalassium TaxID=426701 RepID=A0A1G8VFD9_9LACT|nr:type I restriction enzyme, S subunit [Alkalibacterium thalassium]
MIIMPKYKFEDIALNITQKRKPTIEDMETYIGLEHLDSGSLSIQRWGSKVPIKGDKLIMQKGDVLFGKRNAYLRRASIAPHDGLFSAHGMVLRPNENVILPKLFPFFICSDYFFDAAIRISVGSLSPTINWSALKKLEFTLPNMDEQEKLADILWAANDTKESYKRLLFLSDELAKSQFIEMFGDPFLNPKGWEVKTLGEIADYFIGLTYKPANVTSDGMIVLRSGNIQNSTLVFEDNVRVDVDVKDRLIVKVNDILMCSRNGSADLVGKVAKIPDLNEKMTFGAFMTIIRSDYHDYLFSFFQQDGFRRQLTEAKTSTVNQITKSMLNKVLVPLPPKALQEEYAGFMEQTNKSKIKLKQNLDNLEITTKALMFKNFG